MSEKLPTKKKALELYKTADESGKKVLITLFGKELFAEKDKRFPQSVAEAYKGLKLIRANEIPFAKPKNLRQQRANARFDLEIVNEYMLNGHEFNWEPGNTEKKYIGVFNMSKAGFGFSRTDFAYDLTCTYVGSRLYFQTEEQNKHFCTHPEFLALHKLVLTNQK